MKIIVIGQSGSGKSTLARKIKEITDFPLLPLDLLWHTTDYSIQAKKWFLQEQQSFMVSNPSWIVEGNYTSTLEERIKEADKIIWLKVPRYLAIYRVVWRSLQRNKLIILKTRREKQEFLTKLKIESKNN